MSEVQIRLSELRDAAERLNHAGRQIDQSVQVVSRMIDEALALGVHDPTIAGFALRYYQQRGLMDGWCDQLLDFARRLDEAADEVELALTNPAGTQTRETTVTYSANAFQRTRSLVQTLLSEKGPPLVPGEDPELPEFDLADYVSGVNRPLYDQLLRDQETLKREQAHLSELLQSRQDAVEDLAALKNRLLSYDQTIDLQAIPRIQALETEIANLESEIIQTENSVSNLQESVDELTDRLDRVKPGKLANMRLLAQLEGSETTSWIKDHTYDCVNYIAERMPIPSNIARDAHLWDEAAAKFQEYGITAGDIPLVGSVIVMDQDHSYADNAFGHLLYVERVEEGAIWVTDDDYATTPVKLSDLTDELSGPNIKYLYFPWHTQA